MTKDIFITDNEYKNFLREIKAQVQYARVQAARNVNRNLISLYWIIGKEISERQERNGWGKSVVEQLSKDLKKEFTGEKGFSSSNLWYMRQIYMEYKDFPNLQQLVGEIPWGQNLLIMSKVKSPKEREYYLNGTIQNGWTRDVLQMQIEYNLI